MPTEQKRKAPAHYRMTGIENRVVTAILARVRKRRNAAAEQEGHLRVHSSDAVAPVKLREARFSDFDAVRELKRRWGLRTDSFANWEHLWRNNPALADTSPERPIGWVLEAEGQTVGYLGNISLLYHNGGRKLRAVAGTGFVAAPGYRIASFRLLSAFYSQNSVDLFLATTATEVSGKMLKLFKVDPLPQRDYETVLFWILSPHAFVQSVMKKVELSPVLSRITTPLASLAVRTDKILHRRWARRSSHAFEINEINVSDIGGAFESLWTEKSKEGPQLLADRSPAFLRWHFDIPGYHGLTRILGCFENGELLGYAAVRTDTNVANGLRRSVVADMLIRHDNQEVIEALLFRAYQHSKSIGSHSLEILGFPQSVRRVCSQWRPYSRKYPICPFYYKAADPVLHKTLSDGALWFASPFDGDTILVP